MKKFLTCFILSFVTTLSFAQNAEEGMALDLRSSGKIYVVVAVITIIFIGLAVYLFSIDKRIKKIEKED
jgi:CcmD family protein